MVFDIRSSAHHEAAHAVIYLVHDIDVESIWLYSDGMGMCCVSADLPPSKGRLLAILAGSEAEKLLWMDDPEALEHCKQGWATDYKLANDILIQLNDPDDFEHAIAEAATIVKQNWKAICSVANTLKDALDESTIALMSGDELKNIYNRERSRK